ncbi:hypothetical protein PUNSTDRAFT_27065, partial [Punctularia strigosozonata HHB-11173 SS5]|uniref:uncharacterized protein n=1 Tax=Punctularia strigosozonata (strain HHB-11173) TaxID=741275 RepID=UPI00044163DE
LVMNYTIDDLYGDSRTGKLPGYLGGWNYGPNCPGCTVQPNGTMAFNGSWHDATRTNDPSPRSVTMNFTGSAIYVFCIVPNTVAPAVRGGHITTAANMTFTLNQTVVGTYVHEPDPSNIFLYNVNVHSSEGLTPGTHSLLIEANNESYIAFDYAIY